MRANSSLDYNGTRACRDSLARRPADNTGPQNDGPLQGLTEIAGLDNEGLRLDVDGRMWAIDCNRLKITIDRLDVGKSRASAS